MLGFTYNFKNTATHGLDMHFDWGASQFPCKQVRVGLVGVYKEIGCDSDSGDASAASSLGS